MKKLIIDRNLWRRNTYDGDIQDSALRIDNQFCCLGFYCKDIRLIPEDNLLCRSYPSELGIGLFSETEDPSCHSSDLESHLVSINDRRGKYRYISNGEQERLIAEGFKIVNIEVEFIN